jgi:hypothetical protein
MTAPLEALGERLPRLFARGVELLRERAAGGDAAAVAELEDVTGARAAVRIVADGDAELWLAVEGGELRAGTERPKDLPVRLSVAAEPNALQAAFAEVPPGADTDDTVALRVARAASKRAEAILEGQRLEFHIVLTDVPDLGEVTVRVGVGVDDPPESPRFTATVRYGDLEDARERALPPQQLLMGGRVRFAGDYVPALQLGMQLAQAAQAPRG